MSSQGNSVKRKAETTGQPDGSKSQKTEGKVALISGITGQGLCFIVFISFGNDFLICVCIT
jgi:hypothetical protein